MKARALVLTAVGLLFFGLSSLLAKEADGKWQAEFDSQIGTQKYTFDLKVEGEKVTGKATREVMGEKTESNISDGKIKGEDISFAENVKIMDMDIKIEYSGKIKGDEMKLTRKVGDFASYEITAKRVKSDDKAVVVKGDVKDVPKDFKVVAEFKPGFVRNPQPWTVAITADGKAKQEITPSGEGKTTTASKDLTKEDVQKIYQLVQEADFFTLQKRYAAKISDMPTNTLKVTANGKTQETQVYGPGSFENDKEVGRFMKVWNEVTKKVPPPTVK